MVSPGFVCNAIFSNEKVDFFSATVSFTRYKPLPVPIQMVPLISSYKDVMILLENCFTKIEFFVVLVGAGNRTDLGALAAARAFRKVDIPGCLVNFCGKVSRLAFDAQKLGVR